MYAYMTHTHTHTHHSAPAACAAAAWLSDRRTRTSTSSAPDVAITTFKLMLAPRLQMHAAAADCMKGTSGDGYLSISISDGSPPACTTSSRFESVSEQMLHSAAAAFAFSVASGEIVGVAGLVGAGRTEMLETLFGVTPALGGTVRISDREIFVDSPHSAISAGIAILCFDLLKS